MLVSKPTHGGGSPFGIDLEAGIAKITVRRPAPEAEPADEATSDPGQPGATEEPAEAATDRSEDPSA